jgi:hypothetical protein
MSTHGDKMPIVTENVKDEHWGETKTKTKTKTKSSELAFAAPWLYSPACTSPD